MNVAQRPTRWAVPWLIPLIGAMWVCGPWLTPVFGQGRDTIPSMPYRATFGPFNDGEYREALDSFRREGRGAIKNVQSRWIDSICYHTMIGECYYHMGQLPEALDNYTAAIRLYVAFSDWMIRVKFPPAVQPAGQANARVRITWGASKRHAVPGRFSDSMLIGQGRLDNSQPFRQGGIVERPILFGMDVVEIVRCTSLAIRRRTELLGPACQHDVLTGQLLTALTKRPGPPNHWSECWIDLELGLAQVAAGKDEQAATTLQRSVAAAGQYDHPLTATALLELGRLALARGDLKTAANYFEETTYSAAFYGDLGVLEEGFRYGALVHLLGNNQGMYPPLAEAIRWAASNRYRQLQCSLLLSAAENAAVLGQTKQAAAMLDEAKSAFARRDMASGRLGARSSMLTALVLFQEGNLAGGDQAVAAAMSYMRHGSFWLFHISLVDSIYTDGSVTPRVATDLFAEVLRDPQPADWVNDPMESLAVLLAPHPAPYEHWFEATMTRKEFEKAMEIADRARRHRYFNSLDYGGRLESLRWILEGPEEALDPKDQLCRRDLRVKFTVYEQLSRRAAELRAALGKEPAAPKDPDAAALQRKQLAELGALGRQQETKLREIAVRREAAGLVFPPLRTTAEIQKALPKGHALLVFFATSRHLYGFLLNSERYSYWQVGSPAMLGKQVLTMLHDMGHFEQNHEFTVKDVAGDKWRASAQNVLETILKGSKADFAAKFDQLIVVPDGALWYVPFEMLQVSAGGETQSLASQFRIRYAPTAGLAIPDARGRKTSGATAVVVGRLFPRDDPAVAQKAFDELAKVLPGAVAVPSPLPAPSAVYRTLFDRLIVYDDIQPSKGGVYGWEPIQVDRGKPGNTLGDWFLLPWGGPETVILPGFHTPAENAMKQVSAATAGQEVFLSVCGLMSTGVRTALLSRWRTGGQTSFDLVREFAQELPHGSPSEAWQRAILLCAETPLNLDAEPRLKRSPNDEPPKASHPLFWAGYMLIDSGETPKAKEKDEEKEKGKVEEKKVEEKEKEKEKEKQ